ncbi:MAG: histidine phosphatase family protein [Clostridia bacterium]|nr:histidine phosphatase family protein [Clostridia bacterium]
MENCIEKIEVAPLAQDETRLIFVRHGQSLGNMNHLFLGHTDLDLSDLGYRQAELACRYIYDHYEVSHVYASDLLRAYHTVEPLARRLGLPLEARQGLREIFAGDWEGMAFDDIDAQYHEGFEVWCHHIGSAVCTNGESVAALKKRIITEADCLAKLHMGKTICLGSHATPIRMLGAYWKGLSLASAHELPFPTNASISVAIYQNGSFSRCELYSFDEYMGEIKTKLNF